MPTIVTNSRVLWVNIKLLKKNGHVQPFLNTDVKKSNLWHIDHMPWKFAQCPFQQMRL